MTGPVALVRRVLHTGRGTAAPDQAFDRRLLPPMMLGAALNPINSSIIAVSLVPIGAAFGAPPAQTAWLISALYLATAIGQPVVGRLIDLYGPRLLFLAGTFLTGVAGVVGTVAPNLGVLVAARVLLGFGTCAGYPAAMFLIREEGRRTGRDSPAMVLTALSVTTQTIAVVGPSLGGLLINLGGWRATLAVNIPLAALGLFLGATRLPRTPRRLPPHTGEQGGQRLATELDVPGMALFAGALVALLLFLMHPQAGMWWLLLLAAVAAGGFGVRELRARTPFIDLRVLGGNAPLVATYVRALLAYVVSYAFLYGYVQWIEEGRGFSASQAGLLQLPLFLMGILVVTVTGRRREIRGKLLVGAVGQLAACMMLLFVGPHTSVWSLVGVALVMGVPQGLNSLALQNAVYHQAEPERVGSSAGLLRTFGYLGAIVASAANGTAFPHRADTVGLHHLAWFLLAVAALFLLITVADRSLARSPTHSTDRNGTAAPDSDSRSDFPSDPVSDQVPTADGAPDRGVPGGPNPHHREQRNTDAMGNTALLVMDVQNAITQRITDAAYLPRLATAVAAARGADLPVLHVVVGFRSDHQDVNPRNKAFGALPPGAFAEGDPATAIHPDVAPLPGEAVVTKKRVSAFTGSDLEVVLRSGDIDHLVLSGVATSGVVLSTLRQAADLDYRITVLGDGCFDPDPQVHQVLVEKVFPRQADVVTIDQWTKATAPA